MLCDKTSNSRTLSVQFGVAGWRMDSLSPGTNIDDGLWQSDGLWFASTKGWEAKLWSPGRKPYLHSPHLHPQPWTLNPTYFKKHVPLQHLLESSEIDMTNFTSQPLQSPVRLDGMTISAVPSGRSHRKNMQKEEHAVYNFTHITTLWQEQGWSFTHPFLLYVPLRSALWPRRDGEEHDGPCCQPLWFFFSSDWKVLFKFKWQKQFCPMMEVNSKVLTETVHWYCETLDVGRVGGQRQRRHDSYLCALTGFPSACF